MGNGARSLVFETERLHLRPLAPDDAALIGRLLRNPRIVFWRRPPISRPILRALIKHSRRLNRRGLGWWLVFDRHTGQLLGDVLLQPLARTHEIEIGYHFLPAAWGHGYATEAAHRVLEHAFSHLALPHLRAVVLPRNRASLRIVEKLAFRQRGSHLHVGLLHRYFRLDREDFVRHLPSPRRIRGQQS